MSPEGKKRGWISGIVEDIGAPTVRGVITLAIIGVVVYKFLLQDVEIPWEDFKVLVFTVVAYFFGTQVAKRE
jgi:hypothetical protein